MQEPQQTGVWSLGQEDPLEEEMATHSSILSRIIPWTEEPGRRVTVHGVTESDTTERLSMHTGYCVTVSVIYAESLIQRQVHGKHPNNIISPGPHRLQLKCSSATKSFCRPCWSIWSPSSVSKAGLGSSLLLPSWASQVAAEARKILEELEAQRRRWRGRTLHEPTATRGYASKFLLEVALGVNLDNEVIARSLVCASMGACVCMCVHVCVVWNLWGAACPSWPEPGASSSGLHNLC